MGFRKALVRLRYALSTRYRRRRYDFFWQKVGQYVQDGWWLDLGGGPGSYFLSHLAERRRVILVDINAEELRVAQARYPSVQCVCADGQQLPFKAGALACVFSNSVIEHVPDAGALAEEIRRTAQKFFVQTPDGGFMFETHSAIPIPLYPHLPRAARRLLCKLLGASFEYISSVRYVSENELREFFPEAVIERERVLGQVKSYYVLSLGESPS